LIPLFYLILFFNIPEACEKLKRGNYKNSKSIFEKKPLKKEKIPKKISHVFFIEQPQSIQG